MYYVINMDDCKMKLKNSFFLYHFFHFHLSITCTCGYSFVKVHFILFYAKLFSIALEGLELLQTTVEIKTFQQTMSLFSARGHSHTQAIFQSHFV